MSKSILVMDDAEETLGELIETLEQKGYAPLVVSADDAAARFADDLPELAFLSLLDANAVAVCDSIRDNPDGAIVPIIFVGDGGQDVSSPSDALTQGGDYYFQLPLDLPKVLAKVQTYVGMGAGPRFDPPPPAGAPSSSTTADVPPPALAPVATSLTSPAEFDNEETPVASGPDGGYDATADFPTLPNFDFGTKPKPRDTDPNLASAADSLLASIHAEETKNGSAPVEEITDGAQPLEPDDDVTLSDGADAGGLTDAFEPDDGPGLADSLEPDDDSTAGGLADALEPDDEPDLADTLEPDDEPGLADTLEPDDGEPDLADALEPEDDPGESTPPPDESADDEAAAAEEEERQKAEEQARQKAEEEERQKAEEEERQKAKEKERQKAEEEERQKVEEKERQKAEEEQRQKAEEEERQKAEEEERQKAEEEERQKAEEEERQKAEEEERQKAEEQERQKAEEQERQKAEEEQRQKAEEEEQRQKAEEEIRRNAEEEARRKAEEEIRRNAEEEARRKVEEDMRQRAEEEARLKAENEAKRRAEEEAQRRAEEEARRRAEEEAKQQAEEEARRKAEEAAQQKAEEETLRKAEEEIRHKAAEEARRKAEEEIRHKAAEEARRKAEEEAAPSPEEEARLREEAIRREVEAEVRRKLGLPVEPESAAQPEPPARAPAAPPPAPEPPRRAPDPPPPAPEPQGRAPEPRSERPTAATPPDPQAWNDPVVPVRRPRVASADGPVTPLEPSTGDFGGEQDIAALMATIYNQQVTGRIDFTSDSRQKTIFFERGGPVDAYSSQVFDRMEEYLYREGKITRAQYQDVRMKQLRNPRKIGAYLVTESFLKPNELFDAVRGHLESVVYGVFEFESGSYTYSGEAVEEDDRVTLDVDPRGVIVEGIRRKYLMTRLIESLGAPSSLLAPNTDKPLEAGLLGLRPDEKQVARLVDGTRSIEDLVFSTGLPAQRVYQVLAAMVALGNAEVRVRGIEGIMEDGTSASDAIDRQRIAEKLEQVRKLDYFQVLGMPHAATAYEIDLAYERVNREFAANRFSEAIQREMQAELQEIERVLDDARQVLRNETLRDAYARHLN